MNSIIEKIIECAKENGKKIAIGFTIVFSLGITFTHNTNKQENTIQDSQKVNLIQDSQEVHITNEYNNYGTQIYFEYQCETNLERQITSGDLT